MIMDSAFIGCNLLDNIRTPSKALVVTKNGESYNFIYLKNGSIPRNGLSRVAIVSECFNSMRPAETLDLKHSITDILGTEMRSKWDKKHQQLRALLPPYEKRHKKEVTSILELGLWKAEMEKSGGGLNPRIRAESRLGGEAEVIIKRVMPFL